MSYAQILDQKINDAIEANDAAALDALLLEHFEPTEAGTRPYDAALVAKPEYREALQPALTQGFEGDVLVNWVNRISRARRLVAYRLKTLGGFDGTHIVSEGDSWFQYPALLHDVIDNFNDEQDLAVFSLGAAGDLVQNMAQRREYHAALSQTGARILLLSGGGNDLLGDGRFANVLRPYQDGAGADDLINMPALELAAGDILGAYRQILEDVSTHHPSVVVFGHGYDTPFPMTDGKHFGRPFEQAGIPLALGREVIKQIVDFFAAKLEELTQVHSNYRFIDLKGTVGAHANSWRDELHPEDLGFKRAATPLIKAVKAHIASQPASAFESASSAAPDTNATAGFEANAGRIVVLDPGHGGTTNLPGASWNNAIGPSGSLEKKWTLDVCQRAKATLEQRGFRVLMTRDSDVSISGADRRKVASRAGADCFVSVHFNASTGHNAQGTETYVHPTTTSARSITLMRAVQGAMVQALGHRDRNASRTTDGILRGSYSVIRESGHASKTAVCLHEVSFMDRVGEENRIKSRSYRDKIATALSDGIEAFFAGGFESADSFEMAGARDYDDVIHESAAQLGLSVMQYLGAAELPPQQGGPLSAAVDGSALVPDAGTPFERGAGMALVQDAGGDVLDRMFADASLAGGTQADDSGEDAFIDAGHGVDFSTFGQDPQRDRMVFSQAYGGFEAAGFDYAAFADFVAGLGLRYFTATELLYMGTSNNAGGCAGKNAPPAEHLWRNIAATARMLDEIRHRIGHPVRILSGYRSQAYNGCVGGASQSLHATFNALDWTASGGSVGQWHQAALDVRGENPQSFKGGVGRYNSKNFIHIDTRGHNVDWTKP